MQQPDGSPVGASCASDRDFSLSKRKKEKKNNDRRDWQDGLEAALKHLA